MTLGKFLADLKALRSWAPSEPREERRSAFRFGLVPQLIAVVVIAVLLVGGLISALMVRRSQNTLREQIVANNIASAALAAEFAYRYVEGTQIAIRLLAHNPAVAQSLSTNRFDAVTAELQQFVQSNQRLDGCSIFDDRGINRATGNTPPSNLGNYSGDRDWFQQVMHTSAPYLGLPVVSRATGRPAMPYGVPIFDAGKTNRGVFLCGISLAALNDAIAKFRTGPAARAALIDRRQGGIIIAHPERERILHPISGRNQAVTQMLDGKRGAMETSDSAGEMNLAVYTPVPMLPWGFLIMQPSKVAFAPINEAARQSAFYIAALLIFAVAVSGLLARRIARPLIRLRDAAGKLAGGDIAVRLNLSRRDEVGDLGRAFDRMATALAERSAQLKAAHEELQAQFLQLHDASRLKSEFLANMSHELRTPLNAIIGFAQLIHDGKAGPVGSEQREYLGDVLNSADHLLQLINDVLDLSKVESGTLEFRPEPVQLTRLISEVRSIVQPLAAHKRLAIEVAVAPEVEHIVVDPAKLKQVLYNYLSNAIKFTGNEGRIAVRARAEGDDYFRLEVADTGIGIAPDEIDKLFIAFRQLDSGAAKRHQGTGLGLALTKKIVEAQGGRVGVESTRGRGSLFFAVLPRRGGANAETPAVKVTAPAPQEPTVLVIEDSDADLTWFSQILLGAGYRVESARTGADAVAKARDRRYAAILLDLILPDTGGWDILHSIRAARANESTPVLVVSVIAEKGVAKGFPVQDYLVKPIQSEALLGALKNAGVSRRSAIRQVMVVDDDPTTLKLARIGLQAGGYRVVCHSNCESALRDAGRSDFSAVVLDLLMPQMDGLEFLDRFRGIETCRDTPVIVWTGKDVSAEEMARLRRSAQTIALKNRDGIDAVLAEIKRYARLDDE